MKVVGIDHVSINVQDMDASLTFYGGFLGFQRLETVPMDDGLSITYFEIPGGARLELFDYRGTSHAVQRQEREVGLRHLAFAVDDVDAGEKMLRERGVAIALPATDIPSLGVRAMLFVDPSGVTLELCQAMSVAGEERT